MPKQHELKTWVPYFNDLISGRKTFEVRKNDRDYCEGDTLLLCEFQPGINRYSGRQLLVKVTYVMDGGRFGVEEGVVVMGILKDLSGSEKPSHKKQSESLLCPVMNCGSKDIWNLVNTTVMKCGNCGYILKQ